MQPDHRPRDQYNARIQDVVSYITNNLGSDLDLEQVARISHFSPFHFHRIFTAALGETPQDFINRLRLERAANLLHKAPAKTITEIALSCGFSSSSVFARSFKKHFGVSASSYAKSPLPDVYPHQPPAAEPPDLSPAPAVEVRSMPAMHLAYVADMHGYDLERICTVWNRLSRWATARNLITPDTLMIGISLDDPLITPLDKCRYYACMTVPRDLTSDPLVGFLDIQAARCAVMRVVCTADEIELVYRHFYRVWLPDSGMQPDDMPNYEIYRATPDTHPEGKYVMDVCIPVVPL
jgi:AraC family transcriptional regulator